MGASDHNGSNDLLVNKSALMTPTRAKRVDTTHTDKVHGLQTINSG